MDIAREKIIFYLEKLFVVKHMVEVLTGRLTTAVGRHAGCMTIGLGLIIKLPRAKSHD